MKAIRLSGTPYNNNGGRGDDQDERGSLCQRKASGALTHLPV